MSDFFISNQVSPGRNLSAVEDQATYTLSFLFRGSGIVRAGGKSWALGSQEWSRFEETFTPEIESAVEIPESLETREVKLELGSRRTTWTEPLEEGRTSWILENLISSDTFEWGPWYSPSPRVIPPVFKNTLEKFQPKEIYTFQAEVEFKGVQGGDQFYFGFTPVSCGISEVPGDGRQILYRRWIVPKEEEGANVGVKCLDWLDGEFRIRKVLLKKETLPASPNSLQDSSLLRTGWNYGEVQDRGVTFEPKAYRDFTAAYLKNLGGSTGYILSQRVHVSPGEPVTLSFFYRGTGLEVNLGPGVSKEILETSRGVKIENYRDTQVNLEAGPEKTWRRYWVTFQSLSLQDICRDPQVLRFKVPEGREAWVWGPKLEDGSGPSEWTLRSNSLTKDSGITNPIWCKQL